MGKTSEESDSLMNAKLVFPLKYLSNFWRNSNIPLINCEVELIITWSKSCVWLIWQQEMHKMAIQLL